MMEIGACLGVDYFAEDPETGEITADALKARKLYEILRERGWTSDQYQRRVNDFLAGNPFTGWTPADFLNEQGTPLEPVALHPYSWYLEQCEAGKGKEAACYRTSDGRRGWGWIHDLDGVLDRFEMAADVVPALPVADQSATARKTDDYLRGRQALDRELKLMNARDRIRDLERKVTDQSRQIARYEARIAEDREIIAILQERLNQLLTGRSTIEDVRRELEEV